MSFSDKTITCVECGQAFVFSAGEQETYQQRGFLNEPKRCAPCRSARKASGNGGFRSSRPSASGERFSATCADCGKEAQLPFKPRGDRPVYCSDCFRSHRV